MKRAKGEYMIREKVMIFIDGSNLYHSMNDYRQGCRIDFNKFIQILSGERYMVRTYYFGTQHHSSQSSFFDMLQFSVESIDVEIKTPKYGKEKGVDVALAIKFLSLGLKGAFDVGIIVSGDEDYVSAIEEVKGLGIRVEVASFKNSLSTELRKSCDSLITIDDFVEDIILVDENEFNR